MKISRKELKKIIKEELEELGEGPMPDPDAAPLALSGAKAFEENLGERIKAAIAAAGLEDLIGDMQAAYDIELPTGAESGMVNMIAQAAAKGAVEMVAASSQKSDSAMTGLGHPSLTRGLDPETGTPKKPYMHDPKAEWPESRGLKHYDKFTKTAPGLEEKRARKKSKNKR